MKIAITTIGSRGDIQPYIALGNALQQKGYDVSILTHPWAKGLVESYQLKHIAVGDEIDINAVARQFVENSTSTLKGFRFALTFIFKNLRSCHSDLLNHLKDFDLIIGHGITGSAEADMLEKAFITVSIAPMGLQKDYWKSGKNVKEAALFLADKITGLMFGGPYLNFRKEIGAPKPDIKRKHPYLALIPISKELQKAHPNWKDESCITGFLFADSPPSFEPDEKLIGFIKSENKALLITFGSMFHTKEESLRLYNVITEAITKANKRALLLMPDLNANEIKSPDNILLINNIPYSWLLQHVSMVVHHFGFGTTAETLKAGLASIPIPHIFDQNMRANMVYRQNLCHKPLSLKKLNSQILADAILNVEKDEELKNRCFEIGQRIQDENGTATAVKIIEEYIEKL